MCYSTQSLSTSANIPLHYHVFPLDRLAIWNLALSEAQCINNRCEAWALWSAYVSTFGQHMPQKSQTKDYEDDNNTDYNDRFVDYMNDDNDDDHHPLLFADRPDCAEARDSSGDFWHSKAVHCEL